MAHAIQRQKCPTKDRDCQHAPQRDHLHLGGKCQRCRITAHDAAHDDGVGTGKVCQTPRPDLGKGDQVVNLADPVTRGFQRLDRLGQGMQTVRDDQNMRRGHAGTF